MNNNIINIDEISESRELIEKSPPTFIFIIIYTFIIMLLLTLCWSYFGKKEIVVKSQGIIKPIQSNTIKSVIGGKVNDIKVKEGQYVKKGDKLLSIDCKTIKQQYESLEDTLDKNKSKLNALKKYEKSINQNSNILSKNDEYEKEYFFRYMNFQNQLAQNNNNLSQNKSELNRVEQQIEKCKQQLNDKQNQINKIEQQKGELTSTKSTIFNENSSLNNEIKSLKLNSNIPKKEKNSRIEDIQIEIKNNNEQIAKIESKSEGLINTVDIIEDEIETLNNTILELDLNENTYKNTIKNNYIDSNISKNNEIINIQSESEQLKNQIDECNNQIDSININLDEYSIKSQINGKVHFIKQFNENDTLSPGEDVIKINNGENDIIAEIYIPSTDIANIKVGQKVKLHSYSLPYRKYGFIDSEISELGIDTSISGEDGTNYYLAKVIIKNNKLKSSDGNTASLKEGMTVECQIITGKESYLEIFLKKIDLWVNS